MAGDFISAEVRHLSRRPRLTAGQRLLDLRRIGQARHRAQGVGRGASENPQLAYDDFRGRVSVPNIEASSAPVECQRKEPIVLCCLLGPAQASLLGFNVHTTVRITHQLAISARITYYVLATCG